ncbi:precorrin-3B synthase [Xanthobacter sp. KR7-225]|uniref:precorrin-3B synthase n=1 Tax=Xanthobacter sp. KR7-225 TaxID=3156613 RepID=UPI0032B32CDB
MRRASRPLPPTRRGACPALSAPMATGDGLLVRLVPADGALAPAQLAGLCQAARGFGNGLLEVSARGSLQMRGLSEETIGGLRAAVTALAIAPREGVPLDLSPLAGRDVSEITDARPLARRLKDAIAEAGLAERLGPKVSVVLDGGGAVRLDALSADVRLVAVPGADGMMWALALAGDAATARPVALLPEAEAAAAVLALLCRLAALGRDARMADLLRAEAATVSPPPPPDAPLPLPPCGGGMGRGVRAPVAASGAGARGNGAAATPPTLPSPGRGEGGPSGAAGASEERARSRRPAPPIGRFPLADSSVAQGVGLPFGQIEAETLAALADAARRAGARDLRPAPGRALIATGLSADAAEAFAADAARRGFLTRPDDPRLSVAACPGAPACRSAHMPARALAGAVAAALAPILDGSVAVHLSACTKGCAHPAPAALTFVGMDEGIALVREGNASAAARADFAVAALLPRLDALARAVAEGRRAGEDTATALARLVGAPTATRTTDHAAHEDAVTPAPLAHP